jgi:deoxycytidine triphosphate deaminase
MAILHKAKICEMLENKEIVIESTDERVPFDPAVQITSDTIDLRLYPQAMVYRANVDCADTLSHEPEKYFETIYLPLSGYKLQPGEILFGSALEIICITNGRYIGRISSRGTYSRFGISVTCGRMRFPSGTPHTPDLQIKNHSSKPVMIYPYAFILQLQIETTVGDPDPYEGMYPKTIGPVVPRVSDRDKSVVNVLNQLRSAGNIVSVQHVSKTVEEIEICVDDPKPPAFKVEISPRLRTILGICLGSATTILVAFVINMISDANWSHWKYITLVVSLILLLVLIIFNVTLITTGRKS